MDAITGPYAAAWHHYVRSELGYESDLPYEVLSSRVNENSKILYVRNPRDRVEKVAPWLTVDGDPYPAVVDGKVLWVLDGYTMTDRYPNSERDSFETMISDALTPTRVE